MIISATIIYEKKKSLICRISKELFSYKHMHITDLYWVILSLFLSIELEIVSCYFGV